MPATANPQLPRLLNKVPEVTAIFWIIKILSTTVGETGADFLNFNLGFGLGRTSLLAAALLVAGALAIVTYLVTTFTTKAHSIKTS